MENEEKQTMKEYFENVMKLANIYENKDGLIQLRLHIESSQFSTILFVVGILIGVLTNFFAFAMVEYFQLSSLWVLVSSSIMLAILSAYFIYVYGENKFFIKSIDDILEAGRKATIERERLIKGTQK